MNAAAFAPERVCLTLTLHQVARRSILVSACGDVESACWLERADVEFETYGTAVAVTLPLPLARERGLLL